MGDQEGVIVIPNKIIEETLDNMIENIDHKDKIELEIEISDKKD